MDKARLEYCIKMYTRRVKEITQDLKRLYRNKDVPSYQIDHLNDYKALLRKHQAMLPKPKNLSKIKAHFQCASDGSALDFDI